MKSIENKVIELTNFKIKNWYDEVKRCYGVVGSGTTKIEGDTITVDFIEDGVNKIWSMPYYLDYVMDDGLDYFYRVWCDEAR